jgi:hypothetical protein
MIKLTNLLKQLIKEEIYKVLTEITFKTPIGQGSEHIIYPHSKDPNKVIKTSSQSVNKNQITTFQKHPDIFPIVYKITDKYAVLEKLDVNQVITELEKLEVEFFNLKWHSDKKRKYSILLDDLMENNDDNYDFIGLLYYLLQNNPSSLKSELNTLYSLTQNPELLKKWIDFLLQIISIFGKKDLDIHAEQFGYTPKGQIKLLDF